MFYKGNAFTEKERRGWIYGSFMPQGLQHDNRVEIKIATLNKGVQTPYHWQKTATKIDMIWQGSAVWEIDGEKVPLQVGDYVIIPPGVKTRINEILIDETICQTIKMPSKPDDKVIEEKTLA